MSFLPSPSTNPTLLDWTQSFNEDGTAHIIAEVLNETNEILDDMTFIEGNLVTGHRFSIRTGIPEPTWRRFYQGVQPTKATSATVQVSAGMMEDYSEVDKALADLNGNTATFRMSQDRAKLEGFNRKMSRYMFSGNEALEPETMTGFNTHFNDMSAGNGENIIDGGGTGSDNGSIWLIGWSPATVYGIFPKGSQAGLQSRDLGEVTATAPVSEGSSEQGYYQAYRNHYRWDAGLCIEDWRYVVRIANIDRSALTNDAATGADLPELLDEAMELVPSLTGSVRFAWYMDREMKKFLKRQTKAKVIHSTLSTEMVEGRPITSWGSIPIRRVDQLAVDEAAVS